MLSSGLYNGRDAFIYKVNINGTYQLLQKLPTFFAVDVLFVEVDGLVLLVIANQYQTSDISHIIEYNVPVQIYQ